MPADRDDTGFTVANVRKPAMAKPWEVIRFMGEADDKALVEAAVDDVIDALTKVAA